jgi:ubiquinone/menaquinone biosynthesis C-methylase UbiE
MTPLLPYRERVVSVANGRVLEVGVGSGLNLPLYGDQVREILGLDPSPRLTPMAQSLAERSHAPVKWIAASAEAIPIENASIDTVVMTWTLCSIPDAAAALAEVGRVLRPTGELLADGVRTLCISGRRIRCTRPGILREAGQTAL